MHNGNLNLSVAGMEGYKQSVTHGAPLKVEVSTQNELWTCLDSALKSEVWSQAATINSVNIQSFFLHFQTLLWRHRSVDCQFSINKWKGIQSFPPLSLLKAAENSANSAGRMKVFGRKLKCLRPFVCCSLSIFLYIRSFRVNWNIIVLVDVCSVFYFTI